MTILQKIIFSLCTGRQKYTTKQDNYVLTKTGLRHIKNIYGVTIPMTHR